MSAQLIFCSFTFCCQYAISGIWKIHCTCSVRCGTGAGCNFQWFNVFCRDPATCVCEKRQYVCHSSRYTPVLFPSLCPKELKSSDSLPQSSCNHATSTGRCVCVCVCVCVSLSPGLFPIFSVAGHFSACIWEEHGDEGVYVWCACIRVCACVCVCVHVCVCVCVHKWGFPPSFGIGVSLLNLYILYSFGISHIVSTFWCIKSLFCIDLV